MNKLLHSPLFAWGYLLVLGGLYLAVGWILAAYDAPILMWIWTMILIVYIAWANLGAITVAMLWVVSIVWIAAYTSATPLLMDWKGPTWAISIVGVWIFAIVVVLMLAFSQQALQPLSWSRRWTFYRLVIVTELGLIIGRSLYLR